MSLNDLTTTCSHELKKNYKKSLNWFVPILTECVWQDAPITAIQDGGFGIAWGSPYVTCFRIVLSLAACDWFPSARVVIFWNMTDAMFITYVPCRWNVKKSSQMLHETLWLWLDFFVFTFAQCIRNSKTLMMMIMETFYASQSISYAMRMNRDK